MIAALLIAAAIHAAPQGPDEILCRDPGVRDGATLACGGSEIRLWGVVAPAAGEAGFEPSRQALERLVRLRDVRCRVRRKLTSRSDEAICYVGVRDLAVEQVRQGHARPTTD